MTPHFSDAELTCHDGCGFMPAQEFMDVVETIRVECDFPMVVTSAARCPAYNSKVSSTGRTGPHTTGRAIDIAVRGEQALRLIIIAYRRGMTGIGVSQKGNARFIHIDDLPDEQGQPRPYIWSY